MARFSPSALIDDASGKVGGVVFSKARNGNTLRIRVRPRNPRSVRQTAARAALAAASREWVAMSDLERLAWENYGAGITKHNPTSGKAYHPSGINIFDQLTTKFLQIAPTGSIPTTPPLGAFVDDGVTVTDVGGVGDITFTGSGANTTGQTTELLYQKLPTAARKPSPTKYKHAAFKAFTGGDLDEVFSVVPGIYATAYRKVEIATGQMTPIVTLDIVAVT